VFQAVDDMDMDTGEQLPDMVAGLGDEQTAAEHGYTKPSPVGPAGDAALETDGAPKKFLRFLRTVR
jgi:hypothetical protein